MNYETYEVRIYANGNKEWYQNGKPPKRTQEEVLAAVDRRIAELRSEG